MEDAEGEMSEYIYKMSILNSVLTITALKFMSSYSTSKKMLYWVNFCLLFNRTHLNLSVDSKSVHPDLF